jgi:hypothetical protein
MRDYVTSNTFIVSYNSTVGPADEAAIDAAGNVTCIFVGTRAFQPLNGTGIGFFCTRVKELDVNTSPIQLAFNATAVYQGTAADNPTMNDLNAAIVKAFQLPTLTSLVGALASLPAVNPFSKTTSATVVIRQG